MEHFVSRLAFGLGLVAGFARPATADIIVVRPYVQLYSQAANSLGYTPGQFIRVGADSVVPNGNAGTTGTAIAPNGDQRPINFIGSPAVPNEFARVLDDSAARRGDWVLRFNSPGQPTYNTAPLPLPATLAQLGFVNSISISGTPKNPIFTWSPPTTGVVNGYRIGIIDKSIVTATNSGLVASFSVPADPAHPGVPPTSYQIKDADFTVKGYGLTIGKNYVIQISALQTRDGLASNLSNANTQALSRVYADWTPSELGGASVILPYVRADGVYQFNVAVETGKTYYLDPLVATGYIYEIGSGDALIRSVVLPGGIGDDKYDIYGYNSLGVATLLAHDWLAGLVYDFGAGGVRKFKVTGIETSAGLDPANATAFITGLTFTAGGFFTGTQTPITTFVDRPAAVPSPISLALLPVAMLGLVAARIARR